MLTITNLKKHLGPGLGLRKNKYLLEMPVPGVPGETINILCQSAGLPERTINVAETWHKGRKYVMRGVTDYSNEYEISIVDDSDMRLRSLFDGWMKKIDDSRPDRSVISGASFEFGENPESPDYQTDVNIWQMSGAGDTASHDGKKVYGYKLQNAFPKSVGVVTLDDDDENELSQFSVVIAFSEFIPLFGDTSKTESLLNSIGF